ncbi:hypothetical protein FB45DRAFT_1030718 [Roridomyces roridus]|uniref:Uncharacterized protein n=1 Tax=Roridomyces roridus TaxID=1738132 RepID=A0AAD7BLQ9_9AGAR|nr:hypothetical protein FB45DRAFT_1030718 [Roridomyces roridus]
MDRREESKRLPLDSSRHTSRSEPRRLPSGPAAASSSWSSTPSSSNLVNAMSRGQESRRLPPDFSRNTLLSEPRQPPPGPTAAPTPFTSNLGSPPEFHHGAYRLVPLGVLTEEEKRTLSPTDHFHGVVRNDDGVFLVFNANRTALLNIPTREGSNTDGTMYTTTWTRVGASHYALAPRHPRHTHILMTSTGQWAETSKSGGQVWRYCASAARPFQCGYAASYRIKDELLRAVARSRDAFIAMLAAIAMHFIILDGSVQQKDWRAEFVERTRLPYRMMDSLEDAVEMVLRHPAGMIVDTSESSINDIKWLFTLILDAEVKIHVPIYFFLGKDGSSAANRASWLEDYPFMRRIAGYVQHEARTLGDLPPSPVKLTEYVYIKSNFRRWGILPNPEYLATVKPQPQFPPVERHSDQSEGQTFTEFFARREERNSVKIAAETAQDRERRVSRLQAAEKQLCPSKRGARVFIWEKVEDFWVRKLLQRNMVEDEWDNFAHSQRVFDPFKNEWDLCEPLDPQAVVSYDSDEDETPNPPGWEDWFNDTSATQPSAPAEVQSVSAAATFEHVDAYFEDNDYNYDDDAERNDHGYKVEKPAANFTFKNTLECRVGLVDAPGAGFSPNQLSRPEICSRFLGDKSQPAATLGQAALALVHSLASATTVQEMPAQLFDLCNPDALLEIEDNSGVTIDIFEKVSALKHRSTAYVLEPRVESARRIVVYSGATAMQIVRLQCKDWRDIVSQLYDLGAPFQIAVEHTDFQPSSYIPLPRCASLGVRPEGYRPDQHDAKQYLHMLRRFLCSSRGRLALQAGGIIARLARLFIPDSRLELMTEDVDVETAEESFRADGITVYYHCLTKEEEDLILGVYSIQMNQLRHVDASGHQEKRVSWWPQAGAFYNSDMNVGWWSPDCESWFQGILGEISEGKAVVLNNARWARRIRGYNAVLRAAKNLDSVCADYLDHQSASAATSQ